MRMKDIKEKALIWGMAAMSLFAGSGKANASTMTGDKVNPQSVTVNVGIDTATEDSCVTVQKWQEQTLQSEKKVDSKFQSEFSRMEDLGDGYQMQFTHTVNQHNTKSKEYDQISMLTPDGRTIDLTQELSKADFTSQGTMHELDKQGRVISSHETTLEEAQQHNQRVETLLRAKLMKKFADNKDDLNHALKYVHKERTYMETEQLKPAKVTSFTSTNSYQASQYAGR